MEKHKLFENIPEQPKVSADSADTSEQIEIDNSRTELPHSEAYRPEDFESRQQIADELKRITKPFVDEDRARVIARMLSGRNN